MKKIILVCLALLPVISIARDSFDGCGLGWEVTDKKTYLGTTTRMTTNAVVPPTFGMTTGTIGCDQFESFASVEQSKVEYVAKNYDSIRSELAIGSGEYVDATAQQFNCDKAVLAPYVQKNFNTVVAPAQNGVELYNNLKAAAQNVCS